MKLLIIGHSHTVCIALAAKEMGIPYRLVRLNDIKGTEDLRNRITSATIDLAGAKLTGSVSESLKTNTIKSIVSVGGNYHNVIGLLKSPRPFDFIMPGFEHLPLAPDAELIPFDVIKASVYQRLKDGFLTLQYIAAFLGPDIVHLESPPPLGDKDFLAKNLDIYFREKAAGHSTEIVYGPTRFKLWRLASDLYERFCSEAKIPWLRTPVELDEGLYLPREFYTTNATHANVAFGKAFISAISGIAESGN